VRFPVTGPVRYSMTAREAVELCRLVRPRTVIPVHYEGWTHFRQGRGAIQQQFEQAPADIGRRLQWLRIGASIGTPGEHTSFRPGGRCQNASLRP
jgi:L-ascorbate metabolism protein UlaG (beta-lactamase superfamily)